MPYRSLVLALALAVPVTLLPGCPSDDDDDDNGPDDDDSAATDDDDVTDDDDDDTGDDDTSDDDTYVPEETDGQITLTYSEEPAGGGGVSRSGRFYAHFPTEISPGSGDYVPLPTDLDQCEVAIYNDNDLSGFTPPTYSYESAGTMTVSGPWGDMLTDPFMAGDEVYYQLIVDPDTQLEFGGWYGVSAAGGDFPAFDAPYRLEMPPELILTTPSVAQPFHVQNALDVAWSGGDPDEPVGLFLTSMYIATWPWEESAYGFLACQAANDGQFTIPGGMLGQMPEGDASFVLLHSVTHYKEVDGRWLAFSGVVNLSASGDI